MRVSQSLVANLVRQSADRASRAFVEASQPLRDQTSVPAPSSDLVKANRILALDRVEREFERFEWARETVTNDLSSAESTVASLHELVVSARDLALQLGSDGIDPATRRAGLDRAKRLFEQVLGFTNRMEPGGKYPFTGLAEDRPALSSDGVYQGNDGQRFVEIGPGMHIEATLRGPDIFGANLEVVSSFQNLIAALESGESAQVRASLDGFDTARTILSEARTVIGGRLSTINETKELSDNLKLAVLTEKSQLTQVDVATLAPRIESAQASLEAVVRTSQQLMAQIGRGWSR